MTINLDSQIVASRYDSRSGECSYTVTDGTSRWTFTVTLADLGHFGANMTARRLHLANKARIAMTGAPDR